MAPDSRAALWATVAVLFLPYVGAIQNHLSPVMYHSSGATHRAQSEIREESWPMFMGGTSSAAQESMEHQLTQKDANLKRLRAVYSDSRDMPVMRKSDMMADRDDELRRKAVETLNLHRAPATPQSTQTHALHDVVDSSFAARHQQDMHAQKAVAERITKKEANRIMMPLVEIPKDQTNVLVAAPLEMTAADKAEMLQDEMSEKDQEDQEEVEYYTKVGPWGEVKVTEWYGKLGDNLLQISHAIVFAQRSGVKTVVLPERRGAVREFFEMPTKIKLSERNTALPDCTAGDADLVSKRYQVTPWKLSAKCKENPEAHDCKKKYAYIHNTEYRNRFRFTKCPGATDEEFREAFTKYVKPFMKKRLAKCVQAETEAHDDNMVTIHLRRGNVFEWDQDPPLARQPPCSLYEQIITEGNVGGTPFERVQLVTDNDAVSKDASNPCVPWLLQRYPTTTSLASEMSGGDVCALLSASALVVADSTLSTSMARMNSNLKRVYGSEDAGFCGTPWWGLDRHAAWPETVVHLNYMTSELGQPGMQLLEQPMAALPQQGRDAGTNENWMLGNPPAQIVGPFSCVGGEVSGW